MNRCRLHLSSTLGQKKKQIKQGLNQLSACPSVTVVNISSYHEGIDKKTFTSTQRLSIAICILTILTPTELFQLIRQIEQSINLDDYIWTHSQLSILLLSYNNDIICDDELTVPYPLTHLDTTILVPFSEIDANYIHPVLGQKVSAICAEKLGV